MCAPHTSDLTRAHTLHPRHHQVTMCVRTHDPSNHVTHERTSPEMHKSNDVANVTPCSLRGRSPCSVLGRFYTLGCMIT
eukprot:3340412-Prymnesium_polylepis.1